nr:MAG TPA: hypothetical protein [Caudoviricetes sp.]
MGISRSACAVDPFSCVGAAGVQPACWSWLLICGIHTLRMWVIAR